MWPPIEYLWNMNCLLSRTYLQRTNKSSQLKHLVCYNFVKHDKVVLYDKMGNDLWVTQKLKEGIFKSEFVCVCVHSFSNLLWRGEEKLCSHRIMELRLFICRLWMAIVLYIKTLISYYPVISVSLLAHSDLKSLSFYFTYRVRYLVFYY